MSDRIAVMNAGVIEQLGTPMEIYDHPLTRFVAGFIGESNIFDGTVTAVGDSSQLGNYVTVSHAGAFTTLYAHCSRITASSGQQVALGDPIAEVGETGNATGPHLHFALQQDTVYLDPAYYGIG